MTLPQPLQYASSPVPATAVVKPPMSESLYIECGTCGFEPVDRSAVPAGPCPKCRASTWRQVIRPEATWLTTA